MLCWRWSEDLALRRLWGWLDLTGSSREEHGWREEQSVRQVSSDLTSLHAISLFRWLLVTVNYVAFSPRCHCKIKKQGFDANCCSSFLCTRQPEGPKALFFPTGVTQMNSFRGNQVNVLWLPLRSWNNKMLFFLSVQRSENTSKRAYKCRHMKHFALALFSNTTINFPSLAVPLWRGFNMGSLPCVLAELLRFCVQYFLSLWRY